MYEFEIIDQLKEKRKHINNFDQLINYIKYIEENCNTNYGIAPRSIAQAALATSYYLSHRFDITGFQAGSVMWDFISGWNRSGNKCGLKLIDYDNMLYPQCQDKFEKTITEETWVLLQRQAKNMLEESGRYASDDVVNHWKNIVEGKVPFGYKVEG